MVSSTAVLIDDKLTVLTSSQSRQGGTTMSEPATLPSRMKMVGPNLKNAWVKKDADGHYYLFIECGDNKAFFLLSGQQLWVNEATGETIRKADDLPHRRALEAWMAEQEPAERV